MRRTFLEYNRFIFNGLLFRKNSAPEIMINTATFHREMASYTFAISQSVDGYEHKKGTTDACSNKTEKIAKTLRLSKAMILSCDIVFYCVLNIMQIYEIYEIYRINWVVIEYC